LIFGFRILFDIGNSDFEINGSSDNFMGKIVEFPSLSFPHPAGHKLRRESRGKRDNRQE